jgi:hypothetical protein
MKGNGFITELTEIVETLGHPFIKSSKPSVSKKMLHHNGESNFC